MATEPSDPFEAELLSLVRDIDALSGDDREVALIDYHRSPHWDFVTNTNMPGDIGRISLEAHAIWDKLSDAEKYPAPEPMGVVLPFRRDEDEEPELPAFTATPFSWRDEASIPPRKWLYGRHLLRKFLSLDVAAGGVGKSSLKIGEALAMAANKPIYGKPIHEGPLRVWLYNLEDPNEETERRIHATAKRFRIAPEDIGDRLFVDSGRDQSLVIAEDTPNGARIVVPMVEALINEMLNRRIDVLIVDPFVSSHAVSENDNMAIDLVAKQWGFIADACNCSINLVHHVRKQNGTEATADSARGASSLIGAARSVLVYNRMSKEEAEKGAVPPDQARFYFRTDNDKANLSPPESAEWYRMNNVDLDNGDAVGVACSWQMPSTFDGISVRDTMAMQKLVGNGEYRESAQSNDWVGYAVAEACRLDPDADGDKARIKQMIKSWLKEGVLQVVENEDSKRMKRKFVIVGKWISE